MAKYRITTINEKQEDGTYATYPIGALSDDVILQEEAKTATTKFKEIDKNLEDSKVTVEENIDEDGGISYSVLQGEDEVGTIDIPDSVLYWEPLE